MADYMVIADVGQSLVNLLRENMTPEPIAQPESIGLASPADKADISLGLFLYSIQEYGEIRQTQMRYKSENKLQYPPIVLDLYYLLTAYSTAEQASKAIDEHRILGRAMQVLYDNSILRSSQLLGTLGEYNEEVRTVIENVPIEVLTRIWNFPNIPYRLSVAYKVGPVNIDSTRFRETHRIKKADFNIEG